MNLSKQEWPCEPAEYVYTNTDSNDFVSVSSKDNAPIRSRIGKGAFSTVIKAKCRKNDQEVAIKIMDLENITTTFDDILTEVQTMKLCSHQNILSCFCSFVSKDKLWLILQLMNKGSCMRILNWTKQLSPSGNECGMNEEWLAYIIKEALQGLGYLHSTGHIHRDVKPGNILINSNGDVKLADFGVAGWILSNGRRQNNVKTFVGTLCYMAPEVMEQAHGYDQKADIYSLGITALELAKGAAPYANLPPMKVLVLTLEDDPPTLKSFKNDRQRNGAPFSKAFEDFYKICLQKNAKLRGSAELLLNHEFVRGRTRDSLVEQLLDKIPNIDVDSSVKSNEDTGLLMQEEDKYVAGTTWVFDKDDHPASKSASFIRGRSSNSRIYNIEVLSSGRSYVKISSSIHQPISPAQNISDFLDDFEQDSATLKTVSSARTTTATDLSPYPSKQNVLSDDNAQGFLDEFQHIISREREV